MIKAYYNKKQTNAMNQKYVYWICSLGNREDDRSSVLVYRDWTVLTSLHLGWICIVTQRIAMLMTLVLNLWVVCPGPILKIKPGSVIINLEHNAITAVGISRMLFRVIPTAPNSHMNQLKSLYLSAFLKATKPKIKSAVKAPSCWLRENFLCLRNYN